MPFALRGVPLPHRMVVCQWTLNVVFLTLNILLPLVTSIIVSIQIIVVLKNQNPSAALLKAAISFRVTVGVLQIISGSFLGYGIFKIRRFLGKGISSKQINMRFFILHSIIFVFFMVSVVLY